MIKGLLFSLIQGWNDFHVLLPHSPSTNQPTFTMADCFLISVGGYNVTRWEYSDPLSAVTSSALVLPFKLHFFFSLEINQSQFLILMHLLLH